MLHSLRIFSNNLAQGKRLCNRELCNDLALAAVEEEKEEETLTPKKKKKKEEKEKTAIK